MSKHVYSTDFYDYISQGSRASARVVVPLVLANCQVASVLDVGAGTGSWLAEWMAQGVGNALAVDGAYVDTAQLKIPAANFHSHDLAQPLRLGRRFDLIQSLEVAEHLPADCAEDFVESLTIHGDVVLFSAAVRHQGGEFHVNEQPPEYWRRKFAARGYACFDWLRPLIAGKAEVKPWYRFNSLLYANEAGSQRLGETVLATRLADDAAVPMRGDLAWNARRAAVALIPAPARHIIAKVKASAEARSARNA